MLFEKEIPDADLESLQVTLDLSRAPGGPRLMAPDWLSQQVDALVAQGVHAAKQRAVKEAGLPERTADLADEELLTLSSARLARAEAEAAKLAGEP